jgi:HSP20 family molecular chaperone IbpA
LTINYWNRQIEKWIDVFSDDEPDLMGLQLVREFDNLTKKFYNDFDDDLDEWEEHSKIYVSIRSEVVSEEMDIVYEGSYPVARPRSNKNAKGRKFKRKFETLPRSDETGESSLVKVHRDSPEDVIISDKNIKIVSQLPINNKKGNIKVVVNNDYSVSISHLNSEGKRCIRCLGIPYDIDFDTGKATYKNGILEITFERK